MRIGLIAAEYSFPNNGGGIGTYTKTLALALAQAGHSIHVIADAPHGRRTVREGNLLVHHVPPVRLVPGPLRPLFYRWVGIPLEMVERAVAVRRAVRRVRRRYGLDVVEAPEWGAEGLLLAGPGVPPLVVRFHGPRFLVRELNGLRRTRSELLADRLEQLAVRFAKCTTSPSSSVSQLLARRYKRQDLSRRTTVIPNPVDTDLFQPGPGNASPSIANTDNVLFVGRLERRKGPHILAEALKQVLPACPTVRVVFVGADSASAPGGGSMMAYIRLMLGELAARVDFIGQVPRQETREYYRSATLAVVPSLQEPFGYTCAEALACGAAVVASDTGGLAEMIADRENGRLVPPADVQALAHTLIELLKDPAGLNTLRVNGRRFAVEHLACATVARDTVELYEEVTSWAQVTGRTSATP